MLKKSILLTSIVVFVLILLVTSMVFAVEDGLIEDEIAEEIVSLSLSTTDVLIESNGYSEYVDAIAINKNGSSKNVNYEAVWKSSDNNVAVAYEGRILAQGKGNAVITVSYGDIEKKIFVTVLKEDNLLKKVNDYLRENPILDANRNDILDKGLDMITVYWDPVQDLIGWEGQYIFEAGSKPYGIPYSQTPNQVDNIGFMIAFQYLPDFYDTYYYDSKLMPKYGSDCSGFLSFAWGLSRHTTLDFVNKIRNGTFPKVGSYDAYDPSTADLLNSYPLLQGGDSVVFRTGDYGHTFLIATNNTAYQQVSAYEQTPYYSQITVHYYNQLANNKYMPFSRGY